MLNKVLSALALAGLVGVATYVYVQDLKVNRRIDAFMARGPRFTAHDGQVLCERVRTLEQSSYGYKDSGKIPLSYDYGIQK